MTQLKLKFYEIPVSTHGILEFSLFLVVGITAGFIRTTLMKKHKEKIRMFLPFSWVIPAMISFSYINAQTLNV